MVWLSVATIAIFTVLGVYYVTQREKVAAQSRRGTSLRLSPRMALALGVLWLALAAAQLVNLLT